MAKAAKSNTRARRSKGKPKRAAALSSTSATLRRKSEGSDLLKSVFDLHPGMAMSRSMSEIMKAYIEFPAKLMRCHTPLGVWREQALFAGRLFDLIERGFHQERSRKA